MGLTYLGRVESRYPNRQTWWARVAKEEVTNATGGGGGEKPTKCQLKNPFGESLDSQLRHPPAPTKMSVTANCSDGFQWIEISVSKQESDANKSAEPLPNI